MSGYNWLNFPYALQNDNKEWIKEIKELVKEIYSIDRWKRYEEKIMDDIEIEFYEFHKSYRNMGLKTIYE